MIVIVIVCVNNLSAIYIQYKKKSLEERFLGCNDHVSGPAVVGRLAVLVASKKSNNSKHWTVFINMCCFPYQGGGNLTNRSTRGSSQAEGMSFNDYCQPVPVFVS